VDFFILNYDITSDFKISSDFAKKFAKNRLFSTENERFYSEKSA